MRTIINLPDDYLEPLSLLCEEQGVSRAEVIRRAISRYIQENSSAGNEDCFGLWKDRQINSLEYENEIRSEWESS